MKTILILLILNFGTMLSVKETKLKFNAQIFIDNIPLEDEMKKNKIQPPKARETVRKLKKFYENEKKDKKAALLKILKENPDAVHVNCDKNGNPLKILAQIEKKESKSPEDMNSDLIENFKQWLVESTQNLKQNKDMLRKFMLYEQLEKEEVKKGITKLTKEEILRLKDIFFHFLKQEGKISEKEIDLFRELLDDHIHHQEHHTTGCPISLLVLEMAKIINK